MNPDIYAELLPRLERDYKLKKGKSGWLQGGTCPACGKKELYTNKEHPWVLRCGRLNNCGVEFHVKDLYPDLFENWGERYQKTTENPNAAADAYLRSARGFDLARIAGWYTQESYYDPVKKIGSETVRFSLGSRVYWERIIDQPQRFGSKKAHFNKGGAYAGTCWCPPGVAMPADEIWIVEGIFDSIALFHHDIWAASAMSCNNYPSIFFDAIAEQCKAAGRKRPRLVWALDDGKAGNDYAKRWVARSRKDGWDAEVALIVSEAKVKLDWNDAHQRDRLQPKDVEGYRYNGQLLTAKSPEDKALLIYNRSSEGNFFFDFDNRLYWFEMDFGAYTKAQEALMKQWDAEEKVYTKQELRDKALQGALSIRQIANCNFTALYYMQNKLTDEQWYYLRIDFPHDGKSIKCDFTGAQMTSATEFRKRLFSVAPGALFKGTGFQLDTWIEKKTFNIKTVETIDFIGYSKEHAAWVFPDVAVSGGRAFDLNEEDFFDIGKLSIKSLSKSLVFDINKDQTEYRKDWIDLLWTCFKAKGVVALAFWLGALYAEQIRDRHKTFPFLEIVGDPGSGKSTIIEFMWKLVGRSNHEGFDPVKATLAARSRNMVQVANLPVVMIESDRDGGPDKAKQKGFDWDELKPAYNGRSVRSTGVKNGGNDTNEPLFRAAVLISQNAAVESSPAFMERLLHMHFELQPHTPQSRENFTRFEHLPVSEVSGFILLATRAEEKVLKAIDERLPVHQKTLDDRPDVRLGRIKKNHAQLMALVDALATIVPLTAEQIDYVQDEIICMAAERQLAINADHPSVQEFWEIYDFLEGDEEPLINHARSETEIAVNLNHFVQVATDRRQQLPDINQLKKVLRTSRFRKFVDIKPVNSAIHARYNANRAVGSPAKPATVKCWVFKRG